jgi:hypothetical protein
MLKVLDYVDLGLCSTQVDVGSVYGSNRFFFFFFFSEA